MELLKPFQLFNAEQCQRIVDTVSDFGPGRTFSEDPQRLVRSNYVAWMPLEPQLKSLLWDLAKPLVQTYNWTWFEEPVQISRYDPGQSYQWHSDTYNHRRSSQRVLTLTATLITAPDAVVETESGNFDLAQGQAVIFPSTLRHRATAPSQGQRYSLTVWYMAPRAG